MAIFVICETTLLCRRAKIALRLVFLRRITVLLSYAVF